MSFELSQEDEEFLLAINELPEEKKNIVIAWYNDKFKSFKETHIHKQKVNEIILKLRGKVEFGIGGTYYCHNGEQYINQSFYIVSVKELLKELGLDKE